MTDSPQVPADSETASTKQIGKPLRIFLFEDLDRAAEAAAAVADICTVANALYKKPGTRQYYLVLDRRDQMNTVSQEYATYWQNMAKTGRRFCR